jgi:hypothetical protein
MAYTTINKGSSYFNTVTYTGNLGTLSVTGVGFKPDFVWLKDRSNGNSHKQYDGVRGVTKFLTSDGTDAEGTQSGLTSFDTDGFTLGSYAGTNGNGTAGSGPSYVSWNWLGANTTVSNTSGSITSTVSANTTAGFSVVSYTGTGANATVGHGLGVAPKMVIVKGRSFAGDWKVYNSNVGATFQGFLNGSEAFQGSSPTIWNSTAPTSTVFSIGTNAGVNTSGGTIIAYCFADVKGFSKFGSFTGNGSTNGAFVYTGFKPAFVMIKSSSTGGAGYNWGMWDNKRIGYNPDNNDLRANLANAESTDDSIDLLSNGFKIRTDSGGFGGGSGVTYIYMAFAENPFVTSGGIPNTAR